MGLFRMPRRKHPFRQKLKNIKMLGMEGKLLRSLPCRKGRVFLKNMAMSGNLS